MHDLTILQVCLTQTFLRQHSYTSCISCEKTPIVASLFIYSDRSASIFLQVPESKSNPVNFFLFETEQTSPFDRSIRGHAFPMKSESLRSCVSGQLFMAVGLVVSPVVLLSCRIAHINITFRESCLGIKYPALSTLHPSLLTPAYDHLCCTDPPPAPAAS